MDIYNRCEKTLVELRNILRQAAVDIIYTTDFEPTNELASLLKKEVSNKLNPLSHTLAQELRAHAQRLGLVEITWEHSLQEAVGIAIEEIRNAIDSHIQSRRKDEEKIIEDTLSKSENVAPRSVNDDRGKGKINGEIFIGHGRSSVWKDLKDFIQDRLRLDWNEFNREPAAGLATTERLQEMLDQASFAFLVMTAEDEHADGMTHPRGNVIHEAGLFQGRLGFKRAILLLEEGCQAFSNIHGLTQIRFPQGTIKAAFEEIRRVLEREGILSR